MLYYLVLIAFNFQPLIFRWFLFNKKLKGKLKKMILNFFKKDFGSKYEIPVTRSRCFIGYQAKIGMTEKGKWSVDFDKRSYSQLSLDERSKAQGSIFSLSSLGLTRGSINKGFNTMDSRVYANASHENDILKVPSLGLTRGSIKQCILCIILICGVLLTSTVATADDTTVETCANGAGTVFVGQVTKHKYCVSNKSMNWWNAVAWCDGMGRRMFDRSDCACSGTVSDCRSKCPELIPVDGDKWVNQWAWTASAASSSGNYHIHLSNGNFDGGANRHRSNYANKALCY